MKKAMRVRSIDHVATVLTDVEKGDTVTVLDEEMKPVLKIEARTKIPFGNKISLTAIQAGSQIFKYSYSIGAATRDIDTGDLVHVQNLKSETVDIPRQIKEDIIRIMGIE